MEQFFSSMPVMLLILVWTLPWKGVALWKAAKNGHLKWFIAILVLNTLAILEIVYIFFFSKKSEARNPYRVEPSGHRPKSKTTIN